MTAVIVAGLGRCGTTWVYNCIKKTFGQKKKIYIENTYKDFKNSTVYKTHDYPFQQLPNNVKVIYLFGNPCNIALSVLKQGQKWYGPHAKHMRSKTRDINDVVKFDSMRLEENFDAWYKQQNFPLLTVKYETIYKHFDKINKFLGINIQFGQFKKRTTNYIKTDKKEQLERIYKGLMEKINKAEEVREWLC